MMELTFTRSSQAEADKLRELIERTIEHEVINGYRRGAAFQVTAGATLIKYGTGDWNRTEKRWTFEVKLTVSDLTDDDVGNLEEEKRWASLFERLMQREPVARGTTVTISRELTAEQIVFLGSDLHAAIRERLKLASQRTYQDSEHHWVKVDEIGFNLTVTAPTVYLHVDAVDAPIVDKVLDQLVATLERDMEMRKP